MRLIFKIANVLLALIGIASVVVMIFFDKIVGALGGAGITLSFLTKENLLYIAGGSFILAGVLMLFRRTRLFKILGTLVTVACIALIIAEIAVKFV